MSAGELRFDFILSETNKPQKLSECLGHVEFWRYWIRRLQNVHHKDLLEYGTQAFGKKERYFIWAWDSLMDK